MARTDTLRAQALRRAILQVLRAVQGAGYEGWLSERAVFNHLRLECDGLVLGEVVVHLVYLKDKGYVESRERRASKFERAEVDARILPHGTDLLDEVIDPDPGVEDNRA